MRLAVVVLPLLASCAVVPLVSNAPSDFHNGYATIYTAHSLTHNGKACHDGDLTYYKRNIYAEEHWIGDGYPYYAAPGKLRLAMYCESPVSKTDECLDLIYLDSGGPEFAAVVEKDKSYVAFCRKGEPQIQEKSTWEAAQKKYKP